MNPLDRPAFPSAVYADGGGVKFVIEIIRENGEVLYRTTVDEIMPRRAKTKAADLLAIYSGRGATGARVSNDKGDELYKL